MGEFFHGWRRKVGCVTLVMACAVTAVWIRSRGILVIYAIPLPADRAVVVAMLNGRMGCGVEDWISPPFASAINGTSHESLLDRTLEEMYYLPHAFPCWTVAMPLALLSAYLILWKSRKKPS